MAMTPSTCLQGTRGARFVAGVATTGPKPLFTFDIGATLREDQLTAEGVPLLHYPSQAVRESRGGA
ncbi:hypothetical protein EYF80_014989 [Liparis tanakae]|uniref:Uncharacterized protein n=1 Tax=Liparis tanakae TaxID=230148 RepID=A0A4Z2I9Y3_9TELE|nr:hypothetical protein EYF80_014989 [Liparis tanakae]